MPLPLRRALVLLALPVFASHAQSPRKLTLTEAISLAEANGAEARAAAARLDQVKANGRFYDSRARPQVALQTTLVNFDHGINPLNLPDGSVQYVGQSNNQTSAALGVSQVLPVTGGTVSLSTLLSRTDQFGNLSSRSWASTPVIIGFNQPLFQIKTLEWDRRESDAAIVSAEREYADARGAIARGVANQYMALHRADLALRNARGNAAVADTVLSLNEARYRVGSERVNVLELSRSELTALNKRIAAEDAQLARDRVAAALALLLGLPEGTEILTEEPAMPDMTGMTDEAAVEAAGRNSVAAVRLRADSLHAERQLAQARATSRAAASLSGSVGFNQTGPTLPLAYDSPLGKQRANLGFTLPLMQWGSGKAQVDMARYAYQSTLATARLAMDQARQDARFAARALTVSSQQLRLATIADSIASVQFRVARLQYTTGSLSYTDFLSVQQSKDDAVVGRVDALAKFWDNYYNLKRLMGP